MFGYSFEPRGETIAHKAKSRTKYNVTLADLIENGLLSVGQTWALTYPGLSASATLTADARMSIDGDL